MSNPFNNENIREDIRRHASKEYPREACGLVIGVLGSYQYIPCRNDSNDPTEEFRMNQEDMTDAMDIGEIYAVVHSHPDATSRPSAYDMAKMNRLYQGEKILDPEAKPTPWWIISYPEEDFREVFPQDQVALIGRDFIHGLYDCWQTCADYYYRGYGIEFPNFEREDKWWENADGPSLYEQWYSSNGFTRLDISQIQVGDMVVMQVGRSYHPNHAGIYLGNNPKLPDEEVSVWGQGPFFLHHMHGRKSAVEVYGGQWLERTRFVLRHEGVK